MWSYVQPSYSAAVTWGTNLLLAAEEWGGRVTTLRPAGRQIEVYSTLREDDEAANGYDAELLHFYIVLSVGVVLAFPEPRGWKRLRALLVTFAAILAFQVIALLVTVEHTYAVKLAEVAKRNYGPTETWVYTWLYETFVFLPIQLLPAAVLLVLFARYGGFGRGLAAIRPGRPPRSEAAPRARPATAAAAGAGVVLLAVAGLGGWAHFEKIRARQSEDLCARGWRTLQAGSTEESSRLFREAIALNPSFVKAHDGLGQARLQANNFSAAEAAFREALRHDSGYFASQMGLGSALRSLDKVEEAADAFRRALDGHPEKWEARFNLALTLIQLKRPEEAEPLLAEAIEMNPGFPDARIKMADLLGASGRPCQALPHMEAFVALEPDSTKTPFIRRKLEGLRAYCAGRPAS